MSLFLSKNEKTLSLTFPFDPVIVEKCREIPGRRWNPKNKAWEFRDCLVVRSFLKHYLGLSFPDYPEVNIDPVRLESRVKPYEHQKRMTGAMLWAYRNGRPLGLFAETGTGKTKSVIDTVSEVMYEDVSLQPRFLITCPAPLISVWTQEFDKHNMIRLVNVLHGANRIMDYNLPVWLTSYETLRNDIDDVSLSEFDIAFFDEAQQIKNPSASRSKACRSVRARSKVLLTGTPVGNGFLDLFGEFQAADEMVFGNKRTFQSAFCVFGGWENKEVVGFKNVGLLQEIVRRNSVSVMKKDCLDIPDKTYQTIKMEMNNEQKRVYKRVEAGAVGDVPVTTILAEIAKLRQVSSGFVYTTSHAESDDGVDGDVGELPERKRDTVRFGTPKIDYLDSISYHSPTIIWFNFTEERDQIIEVLERNCVPYSVADGSNKASRGVENFESGKVKVLVAQLQSVQYGFTCNRARRVIYYSPTFSLLQRSQSEDRSHRIGQTESVHYITLVSSPVEEWMMQAVSEKTEVKDFVMKKLKNIS